MIFDETMLVVISSLIISVIMLVYLYFKNIEKHTQDFIIEENPSSDPAMDADPIL